MIPIITQLSYDLVDESNHAWSEQAIASWVNEAINLLVSLKPEIFRDTHVIKADDISNELDRLDVKIVYSVLGVCTADGDVYQRLNTYDSTLPVWVGKDSRCGGEAVSYTVFNGRNIFLRPQGVSMAGKYLLIEAVAINEIDKDSLPLSADAIVKQWVLYRARSMDSESSVVGDLGAANYQVFKDLISMEIKV